MAPHSVVIVGAGQAGFQTAAALRQDGFEGEITLVGNEPGVPYQRPPLSKAYLMGKVTAENIQFRPEKFYAEHRITLLHGEAEAIARTNRRVTLRDGNAVAYDHLVLALGAHNRALPVPGAELKGVYGLRTMQDADAIAAKLKTARNVVVVGAGFIGLEIAAVAAAAGASVHVLELGDRPMARALTPETSAFFTQAHRGFGVQLDFRQGLGRIVGEAGSVTGVETSDGRTLPADLVVVGIGILPNVQLATETGLDIENGIRVDAYLLTSDPAISAVGDCAFFPSQYADGHIRLESVQNAADQARAVAARLTGKATPYVAVPWFWSDQGDLRLQIAGLLTGYDSTVTIGDPAQRQFSVLCFARGHLVAVESVNRAAEHMAARKIIARRGTFTPQEAAAPGFDLKVWEAANR
jgi:3-phenylpropionate/trans-cinnamate dioxygenase ferredoxin reductase subunit